MSGEEYGALLQLPKTCLPLRPCRVARPVFIDRLCFTQGNVKDFQLWVISRRDNVPYPLIGESRGHISRRSETLVSFSPLEECVLTNE